MGPLQAILICGAYYEYTDGDICLMLGDYKRD
jgi:hypothetical protein